MSQPRIEVKGLSKVFYQNVIDSFQPKQLDKKTLSTEDKLVLNNLNFSLHSGETIGIIGSNGAGKSTLLSILAGVAKQTDGEVDIYGKVTAVMTLGIGLREDLTGRQNIYLDGQLQGKSRSEIDAVIDDIIAFAELDDFIDKPIKIYSTGMKSRLAFSMLVCIEPEILIIDEALSAGDAFFAQKATKKIQEICRKGKIVIIVSHSMGTIETMCNRCLWIEKGTIIMDGSPSQVTKSYLRKVREDDQLQEISSHQQHFSYIEENANYKVLSIKKMLSGSDYEKTIFHTNDSLTISIEMERLVRGACTVHLVIERLDGLIVSHEQIEITSQKNEPEKLHFNLQFSLDSLVLNKGYYKLGVEVFEKNQLTNKFVQCFEVKNEFVASGGFSALQYPAEIISYNEDVKLCSDSIELITV